MKKTTKTKQNHYEIGREKFFETEERKAIMKSTEDRSLADQAKGRLTWQVRWMLVHLAMYSGLRVSEIVALKIKRVNIDTKEPYIRVYQGKGGKSRDVYIDSELTQHLKEFIKVKQVWDQSIESEAPLFAGRGGKLYTTNALSLSFKEAVKSAGLRTNLSIHSARHSYATLLYYKTKDLRDVQIQLGHSNVAMTTLYSNIFPEQRSRIANAILDEDEKPSFKRTKKPAGKFKSNKEAEDLYRLQFAARELNRILFEEGDKNRISTDLPNKELITKLREVSKEIRWENEGEWAADDLTDETRKVLKDFNIKS